MKEFVINDQTSGRKSATYLSKILPNASFGFIQKMMRKKNITLNNKKMTGNEILQTGDSIKIFFSDETFDNFTENKQIDIDEYIKAYKLIKNIRIIYEDEQYIILYKPTNVLSQKADNKMLSLNEWLIGYLITQNKLSADSLKECKPSICNRLDRNTSGLVLAAKTVHGLNTLNKLIKNRSIEKHYLAKCLGAFEIKSQKICAYLHKEEDKNVSFVIDEFEYSKLEETNKALYKPIQLQYNVIREYKTDNSIISDVDIDLITGKSHQIRAQMAKLGHPLLGDEKYGNKQINHKLNVLSQQLTAYKLIFPICKELGELSDKTITIEVH